MALRLDDHWIWDFWIADTGSEYHVFFLKAPKSLVDPGLRHANARVGHAVSPDLTNWEVIQDAIVPGALGSWDDRAIWTGSVIDVDGVWHMLYTGTNLAEGGLVQRIGLATSDDLVTWTKFAGNPVMEADPTWYEKLGGGDWYEEAWRDPWVMRVDDQYHVLVTARSNVGPSEGRGVIGHAVSGDLREWDVLPPLSDRAGFGHLEVPQTVDVEGQSLLLFSCEGSKAPAAEILADSGDTGDATYLAPAGSLLGPFDIGEARQAVPPPWYSGRLVRARGGEWVWLAFSNRDTAGEFVGEISDPIPLRHN